jgi:transposase
MSKKILRQSRQFSPTLRQEVVKLIETGKLSVASASREYHVSLSTIYLWIYRYSSYNHKGAILVVDKKSHSQSLEQLQQRIAELERAVGLKQMKIDYYEKFIEFASEEVGHDLKKKYDPDVSSGSLPTKKESPGR